MDKLTLNPIASQSFRFQMGGISYDIRLKALGLFMVCDVSINNSVVITGLRVVSGSPLIPFKYLENGNLIFVTANEEEPFYTEFGETQFLYAATQSELEALNG